MAEPGAPKDFKEVPFKKWTTKQVGAFLHTIGAGLEEHVEAFEQNDILGSHLELLDREDLKLLGVESLGRRLLLTKEIGMLQAREKLKARKQVIEKQYQAWPGSCTDRNCSTFCGLFPWDPDKYILTSTNLRIKKYEVFRLFGCCRMTCCGGKWTNDNIPLNKIVDVDARTYTEGWPPFKEFKCELTLQGVAGNQAEAETSRLQSRIMLVEGEVGEAFQATIRNAIEEYKLQVGISGKID